MSALESRPALHALLYARAVITISEFHTPCPLPAFIYFLYAPPPPPEFRSIRSSFYRSFDHGESKIRDLLHDRFHFHFFPSLLFARDIQFFFGYPLSFRIFTRMKIFEFIGAGVFFPVFDVTIRAILNRGE